MSKKTLDELGVSAFCESMAMMVQSGIQTDEAIGLLQSEKEKGGILKQALGKMKTQTEQGSSLSEAMKDAGIFPDFAVRMVAAGESSGRLENVLFRLARYYAGQKTLMEKLRGAVTYPAAMLVLIVTVLAAMLIIVLPAFRAVYDRLTGSLAASSYAYIRAAALFCTIALVVMAALVCLLLVGLLLWKSGRRRAVLAVLEIFPRCRSILRTGALYRFTSAVETFLASGEMQDEAVLSSIPMVGDEKLEEKLRALVRRMEKGHSFSQAAYEEDLFERRAKRRTGARARASEPAPRGGDRPPGRSACRDRLPRSLGRSDGDHRPDAHQRDAAADRHDERHRLRRLPCTRTRKKRKRGCSASCSRCCFWPL